MTVRRPWEGSTRRQRLPADWFTPGGRRDRVFARPDGRVCALQYRDICTGFATQVDHIILGDDHSDANLQPACQSCHRHKSALEGAAAKPRERRPPEEHPALK
jgi:5-methylcytosine-specific restriction endonuclease McrA